MSSPANAARKDNLTGICHAIGEDFGFNPFLLRVTLAVAIVFSPEWTLAAYGAMGVAVLASRLFVRAPRKAIPNTETIGPIAPASAEAAEPFALAA